MKKVFIILTSIIGILVIGLIILATVDFNRLGKENMYVYIGQDGQLEEDRTSTGEVFKRYWYTLDAVDEDGEITTVEFSSHKNLRVGAYLKLYVKNDVEVTSYDEVKAQDIPEKSMNNLNK